MAMDLFNLVAKISLDKSEFEGGISKLDSALSGAMKVGAAAIGAATAAVGAFGAKSVQTGMDFDKSMSQVAATMGKTMEEMEGEVGSVDLAWGKFSGNLREYAQEMGANTAFSATQAADALNYMALAGYDTQTAMEMLPNVLNLAAAGNMDLARSSDMVTDAQTAFGISGERTTQMVDEMAKAASTGNTSVEQLGDAFLIVGGLAQELNGGMVTLADGTQKPVDGLQELEIALTAMANAGVKGSEAGTHMRNMLLKLSDPTDAGYMALQRLGVAIFDDTGKMRSLNEIFGDLSSSMEELTQEEKIQAISALFNTRDIASAEALLNAIGQDWDEIGESILDAEGAAQKMADTQLDNLAGDITLFKSALEGTEIAISDGLTPTIRTLVQGATRGLTQITSKLTQYLQKEETQEKLQKITDAAEKLINLILDNLDKIFDVGITVITGVMNAVGFLIDNIDKIVPILSGIAAAWGVLKAANIVTAISNFLPIIASIVGAISGIIPVIISLIIPVTLVVAAVAAAAIAIIANWDKIKAVWGKAVEFFGGVWNGIRNAFKDVGTWISSKFTSAYNEIQNTWKGIGTKFGQYRDSIWNAMKNVGSSIAERFTSARNSIMTGWSNISERFVSVRDAIISIFKNLPEYFGTMGKNIITGLYNGVVERFNGLIENFKSIGNSVINIFNSIFKNASPSKVFKQIGGYLMEGMAIGIEDKSTLVESAMKDVSDMVFDNTPDLDMVARARAESFGSASGGSYFSVPRQKENKQLTVILELDRMVLGRAVYNLNNDETQRVGVRLAGGIA